MSNLEEKNDIIGSANTESGRLALDEGLNPESERLELEIGNESVLKIIDKKHRSRSYKTGGATIQFKKKRSSHSQGDVAADDIERDRASGHEQHGFRHHAAATAPGKLEGSNDDQEYISRMSASGILPGFLRGESSLTGANVSKSVSEKDSKEQIIEKSTQPTEMPVEDSADCAERKQTTDAEHEHQSSDPGSSAPVDADDDSSKSQEECHDSQELYTTKEQHTETSEEAGDQAQRSVGEGNTGQPEVADTAVVDSVMPKRDKTKREDKKKEKKGEQEKKHSWKPARTGTGQPDKSEKRSEHKYSVKSGKSIGSDDISLKHSKLILREAYMDPMQDSATSHQSSRANRGSHGGKSFGRASHQGFGMEHAKHKKIVRTVSMTNRLISVKELAEMMAERKGRVIKYLKSELALSHVTGDYAVDVTVAELVVENFGHKFKLSPVCDINKYVMSEEESSNLPRLHRPPVVTVMGHVDHGKTTLLDTIRHTNVTTMESGGITQHIGAYEVSVGGDHSITFVDTPGHQAFTAMRAAGTNVTDIAIVVVAADDGIKRQTVEAINHAKSAKVPIVVAVNKIDRVPSFDISKIKSEFLVEGVTADDLGGDVPFVPISAKASIGIDQLIETLLVTAELMELREIYDCPAIAVSIESKIDKQVGAMSSVIVKRGTLRVGDVLVGRDGFGRVKSLINSLGKSIAEATPSVPVQVIGMPMTQPGREVYVVSDEKRARAFLHDMKTLDQTEDQVNAIAEAQEQQKSINGGNVVMDIFSRNKQTLLPLVLKCDVVGSQEAASGVINGLHTDEVQFLITHKGIGEVSESDVLLAEASGGEVIAFNVKIPGKILDLARSKGVSVTGYAIIYELIDYLRNKIISKLSPVIVMVPLGSAVVKMVFSMTKNHTVLGCLATSGLIKKGAKIKIERNDGKSIIYEGTIKALKRFKDDVKEVKNGLEFGVSLEHCSGGIEIGDVIQVYEAMQQTQTLPDTN